MFTDNDGQVYHFTVEGNSVKDSARIPPDVSPASSTSLLSVLVRDCVGSIPSEAIPKLESYFRKFNVNKFSI